MVTDNSMLDSSSRDSFNKLVELLTTFHSPSSLRPTAAMDPLIQDVKRLGQINNPVNDAGETLLDVANRHGKLGVVLNLLENAGAKHSQELAKEVVCDGNPLVATSGATLQGKIAERGVGCESGLLTLKP